MAIEDIQALRSVEQPEGEKTLAEQPSVEVNITETQEINWNKYEAARWILIVQELRRKYTPEHFYNLELIPRPLTEEDKTHLYTSIYVPCEGAIIRNGNANVFPALLPIDFAEKRTETSTRKPIVLVRQLSADAVDTEVSNQPEQSEQKELSLITELLRFMLKKGHFLTASNIAYLLSSEAEPVSLFLEKPHGNFSFRSMFITQSRSLDWLLGLIQNIKFALREKPVDNENGENVHPGHSVRKPYQRILWNDFDWTEHGSGKRYGEPGMYIDPEGSLTVSVWVNGVCYLLQTGMSKLPDDYASEVFYAKLKALQVNFQADLINAWVNAEEKLKFMQFMKEMKANFKPEDLILLMDFAKDSLQIIIDIARSGHVSQEDAERMLMEAQMAQANFIDRNRILEKLIQALQEVQQDMATPVASSPTRPISREDID